MEAFERVTMETFERVTIEDFENKRKRVNEDSKENPTKRSKTETVSLNLEDLCMELHLDTGMYCPLEKLPNERKERKDQGKHFKHNFLELLWVLDALGKYIFFSDKIREQASPESFEKKAFCTTQEMFKTLKISKTEHNIEEVTYNPYRVISEDFLKDPADDNPNEAKFIALVYVFTARLCLGLPQNCPNINLPVFEQPLFDFFLDLESQVSKGTVKLNGDKNVEKMFENDACKCQFCKDLCTAGEGVRKLTMLGVEYEERSGKEYRFNSNMIKLLMEWLIPHPVLLTIQAARYRINRVLDTFFIHFKCAPELRWLTRNCEDHYNLNFQRSPYTSPMNLNWLKQNMTTKSRIFDPNIEFTKYDERNDLLFWNKPYVCLVTQDQMRLLFVYKAKRRSILSSFSSKLDLRMGPPYINMFDCIKDFCQNLGNYYSDKTRWENSRILVTKTGEYAAIMEYNIEKILTQNVVQRKDLESQDDKIEERKFVAAIYPYIYAREDHLAIHETPEQLEYLPSTIGALLFKLMKDTYIPYCLGHATKSKRTFKEAQQFAVYIIVCFILNAYITMAGASPKRLSKIKKIIDNVSKDTKIQTEELVWVNFKRHVPENLSMLIMTLFRNRTPSIRTPQELFENQFYVDFMEGHDRLYELFTVGECTRFSVHQANFAAVHSTQLINVPHEFHNRHYLLLQTNPSTDQEKRDYMDCVKRYFINIAAYTKYGLDFEIGDQNKQDVFHILAPITIEFRDEGSSIEAEGIGLAQQFITMYESIFSEFQETDLYIGSSYSALQNWFTLGCIMAYTIVHSHHSIKIPWQRYMFKIMEKGPRTFTPTIADWAEYEPIGAKKLIEALINCPEEDSEQWIIKNYGYSFEDLSWNPSRIRGPVNYNNLRYFGESMIKSSLLSKIGIPALQALYDGFHTLNWLIQPSGSWLYKLFCKRFKQKLTPTLLAEKIIYHVSSPGMESHQACFSAPTDFISLAEISDPIGTISFRKCFRSKESKPKICQLSLLRDYIEDYYKREGSSLEDFVFFITASKNIPKTPSWNIRINVVLRDVPSDNDIKLPVSHTCFKELTIYCRWESKTVETVGKYRDIYEKFSHRLDHSLSCTNFTIQ